MKTPVIKAVLCISDHPVLHHIRVTMRIHNPWVLVLQLFLLPPGPTPHLTLPWRRDGLFSAPGLLSVIASSCIITFCYTVKKAVLVLTCIC